MKRKEQIKVTGVQLFNEFGINNVTLRDVAKKLDISYGNVTYHFGKKEHLILELYQDMKQETVNSLAEFSPSDAFDMILQAPAITFDLSLKYSFLFVDYIEIKRNYPTIFFEVEQDIETRKKQYYKVLKQLQTDGILRNEIQQDDLNFLMDLSGAFRSFYFMSILNSTKSVNELKNDYSTKMNRLLIPYLSTLGMERFNSAEL